MWGLKAGMAAVERVKAPVGLAPPRPTARDGNQLPFSDQGAPSLLSTAMGQRVS
jgi:hypothetical protein